MGMTGFWTLSALSAYVVGRLVLYLYLTRVGMVDAGGGCQHSTVHLVTCP